MFLKAPSDDCWVVTNGERTYPARGGVFLIDPGDRARFAGFPLADEVPDDVARELSELGSWHADLPVTAVQPVARQEPVDGSGGVEVPSVVSEAATGAVDAPAATYDSLDDDHLGDEWDGHADTDGDGDEQDTPEPETDEQQDEAHDDQQVEEQVEEPVDVPHDLHAMKRADLDTLATNLGLDPDRYPNKLAVIEAIQNR